MKRVTTLTALAGLGGLSAATLTGVPASAATVDGCGDAPNGGTLQRLGDICELDYSSAGSYEWVVPEGLTDLYAVVVGAGGGAYFDAAGREGYAGSGGDVEYVDLSGNLASSPALVVVGAGGSTRTSEAEAQDGGDSRVTLGAAVVANGGPAGTFFGGWCIPAENYSVYVGSGSGANGTASTDGASCDVNAIPGVAIASGLDSSENSALPIFGTSGGVLGAGGRVVVAPSSLDSDQTRQGSGRGADVLVNVTNNTVPEADAAGADGRVIFRYTAITPADNGGSDGGDTGGGTDGETVDNSDGGGVAAGGDEAERLPETGTDVGPLAAFAALLTALGLGAVQSTRRRATLVE